MPTFYIFQLRVTIECCAFCDGDATYMVHVHVQVRLELACLIIGGWWIVDGGRFIFVFMYAKNWPHKFGHKWPHKWPSGLRRHVQVVILIGAGSNPVLCTYFFGLLALQFDDFVADLVNIMITSIYILHYFAAAS